LSFVNDFLQPVVPFLPLIGTGAVVAAVLWAAHWLLLGRYPDLGSERRLPRQLAVVGLTLLGVFVIALALPVGEGTRNQVIALLGLLVSGTVAFSSTTIVANLMAGVMLRVTQPFRAGDFVRVGEHFGRVAERGLLDTEIQAESRDLIAIPNTYMITHPVSVVRGSGTIVATTVSLSYEVHHSRVESLLAVAARECELEDPFVQILELGDYAVTYRVSGLLIEVKGLLTARSNLCRKVLDILHGHGIEIVSPTFMNQRRLAGDDRVIPRPVAESVRKKPRTPEEIVFDKAERAAQREKETQQLKDEIKRLEGELKDAPDDEKKVLTEALEEARKRLAEFARAADEEGEGRGTEEPD
jgi:small-conductance mechanosensitive channel